MKESWVRLDAYIAVNVYIVFGTFMFLQRMFNGQTPDPQNYMHVPLSLSLLDGPIYILAMIKLLLNQL